MINSQFLTLDATRQVIKKQLADGVTTRRVGLVSTGAPARAHSDITTPDGEKARAAPNMSLKDIRLGGGEKRGLLGRWLACPNHASSAAVQDWLASCRKGNTWVCARAGQGVDSPEAQTY